jgi:predicted dehydrogenase
MDMNEVKCIGIVGCGSIAEEHLACLRALDERLAFAFCDREAARALALQKTYDGTYATTDAGRIFDDPAVDAVYILTHHDSHASLAVAAARAGKHILIEKPLAMSTAESRAIGGAVEQSGVILMPAFKLRFYPLVRMLRERIPAPRMLVAQLSDRRWDDGFWANDPRCGGGNVFSQGGHAMDLLAYLAGAEPLRIHAEGGNYHHPGLDIIDALTATVSFANGACAAVAIGDLGTSAVVSKFSFQVMDGRACGHLHDRFTALTIDAAGEPRSWREDRETGVLEENRAFLDAIRTHQTPPLTWKDGERAVRMIEACFESIHRGAPVTLTS